MILGADIGSLHFGFAVGQGFKVVESGTWSLKLSMFDDHGMRPIRLRNHLSRLYERCPFNEIAIEAVRRHEGTIAAQLYGMMLCTLIMWAKDHGIVYYGVDVGVWKRDIVGRGNAGKKDIKAAVKIITGIEPATDDEADAIAILLWRLRNSRDI